MPGFDNSVMYADNVDFSGGTPVVAKVTADGELLIGSTASPNIRVATLTAGAGIGITNGAGSITITNTGSAFPWTTVAVNTALAVNNGYISNGGALITHTLPGVAAVGDVIEILGRGAGLFSIAQPAGVTIRFGGSSTTTGVGGSLTSLNQFDTIQLKCLIANTDWSVTMASSNFTIV